MSTSEAELPVETVAPAQWRPNLVRFAPLGLAVVVLVSALAASAAMRRTSTTFDEIVMIAGGARGFETGRFDLAPEHPPFTQYLYGLPVFLAGAHYPPEVGPIPDAGYRYRYARQFFWRVANDPERLAFLGRLMGVACAAALVLAAFRFARPWGPPTALLTAALIAFLPDLLAHSGVAYNDVPLALVFFLSLWAIDVAARQPTLRTGALAGGLTALALSIKFSAIILLPVALLVIGAEAISRRLERGWLRQAAPALLSGALAGYLTLVLVYRGDFVLAEFIYGLRFTFQHVNQGHGAPAYLLGHFSTRGWWFFYPVAFFFKTPVALHVLAALAVLGFASKRPAWRAVLASRLRAPLLGVLVFGAALLTSSLDIGFRYALPALPLICLLIAVGATRLWSNAKPLLRALLVTLPLAYTASSLAVYPHFLGYISEYGPGQGRSDLVLLDSSTDWGQGLLELRDFMHDRNIDRVFLSYFGSALPEGYGIEYVMLPSFFTLPQQGPWPSPAEAPPWVVISSTNLHGVYLGRDAFARFRALTPDTILANSLFVYRLKS